MLSLDPRLLRAIERGTVVTPSPPRAAALRRAHDLHQMRGCSSWRTADTLGLRAWLEREAYRAADAGAGVPRPLSAVEEWLFWREAVAADAGEGAQAARLAESLARAARLLGEWDISPSVLERSGTEESERLAHALAHLASRCREARAAPSHVLIQRLQGIVPRRPVVFAGFTESSAARSAWMRAALERSASVEEYAPEGASGRLLAARASDPHEELELAALWCRAHLESDPARRLLVMVPDLLERRAEAVRAFRQALTPRRALEGDRLEGVLAVEAGEPLSGTPLVRHALTSLELLAGRLEPAAVSAWLRSAFWHLSASARALVDAWLRADFAYDVSARELISALEAAPPRLEAASALRSVMADALEALGRVNAPRPLGAWAQRFQRALEALGWPGPQLEAGPQQPARARFAEALGDLASIGGRMDAVSAPQAVRLLGALAARSTVLPASDADAAVTLTAALADPIVRYDGIWVAGRHAEAWPEPPAANPFIPLAIQRQAGLPGVSAASSLARARALLDRWRGCASELVLSWPERIEDCGCLPSPLVVAHPDVEAFTPGDRGMTLARLIRRNRTTESFEDARGSPWPAGLALPSGTRVLDLQSRCPFRAYAELRLSARDLERPRPGVDPRDRGRLLHRALELLWQDLGDGDTLEVRAAGGTLKALIKRCVARAADETLGVGRRRDGAGALAEAYPPGASERREIRRAERLIHDLTALEGARPPFRVRAMEQVLTLQLAGAELNLRIDRIDELDDGTLALLDYKTGKPATLDWLGERLADPQLLVYLLATAARASTLAQVQLRADGITFRGLADRKGRLAGLPGLSPDGEKARDAWLEQVDRWRRLIERLARDFLDGAAAVDPAPGACRACHLHAFCRVSETDRERASPTGAGER